MSTLKKILDVITTVAVILAIVLAVALVGIRLVGIDAYTVLSGSMEPTIHTGSLVYVKPVDPAELKEGDIITFAIENNGVGQATHRIIEIVPKTDKQGNPYLSFVTKGDANEIPDEPVYEKNVVGKVVFYVPFLGYVANAIQTPPTLYIAIAVVLLLVVLSFLPDRVFGITKNSK